jgi:hypothetical protein
MVKTVDCCPSGCDATLSYRWLPTFQKNISPLVGGYQGFRGTEDGADMVLRNVSNHLQDYMASQPRRP